MTELRLKLTGVALSALCLFYFYLLDRLLFSSAHFSPIFRFLLNAYDWKSGCLALAVCCFAALWHWPPPVLRLVDFLGRHPIFLAIVCAVLFAAGCLCVYHDYPLSMDEYAAVFQAKIFALGRISVQLPRGLVDWLVVRGFNGSFLIASSESGRAIEQYWPGFALLLAPFQFFKMPWLCNAALSGIAIYLVYWITKEITGERRLAGWAILFTFSSGAFVAYGVSYYSMQAHLTANLLFVAFLLNPSAYRALAAGLVGSVALILHNPVPHALFAAPWIIALVMQPERRRYLLPLALGYLPGVAMGFAWLILRTEILSAGPHVPEMSAVLSGIFAWPDTTMINARVAASAKMWIWAVPCLFMFAVIGGVRYRENPHIRLLAQSAVLTFIGYLFVMFDQGHGWGYRYIHSAWGAIPILAACAMSGESERHSNLTSFAGAAAILNLVIVVPYQLFQINEFVSQHLTQISAPRRPGNNIYFVHPRGGFYVADMVQFDPLLRDSDLLLVSHGADLDSKLILKNWPTAVRIWSGVTADQWYLGEDDRRVPISGRERERQFVIPQIPR